MARHLPRPQRPARRRDDRGSVAVEFALAVPGLILIVTLFVQFFAWGAGFLIAHAAADHALQTTRVVGGTPAAGQADATAALDQLGGRLITDHTVTVTRTAVTSTVTIRGHAYGLPLPITITVQAPTERRTP